MKTEARKPFTVLVADEATHAVSQAFDEAARLASRIPLAGLHVVYIAPGGLTLSRLEEMAPGLREKTLERAAALGVAERMLAVHVRACDAPAAAIAKLARELVVDLVVTREPSRRGLLSRDVVETLRTELSCPLVTVAPFSRAPEVEPLCQACAAIRERTNGKTLWCSDHANRRIRAHGWSYQRDIPLATHDSEFIPTGISFP
jgi:nucleotide-binding universal stress UspA family protein